MKTSVFAVLLTALALPAFATPELPDGKWWKRPRIAAEIGLTPEQSKEIEKIFVRSRTKLIDLRADLEKKQLLLQEAMEDPSADRKSIAARIDVVENARAELQKARALMILDMKQVLKPEQWEHLLQKQQEIRERQEERRRMLREEGRSEEGARPEARRPRDDRQPPR